MISTSMHLIEASAATARYARKEKRYALWHMNSSPETVLEYTYNERMDATYSYAPPHTETSSIDDGYLSFCA